MAAVALVGFGVGVWSGVNHEIDQQKEGERITEARQEQVQAAIDGPIKAVTTDILRHQPKEPIGHTHITHVDPEDRSVSLSVFDGATEENKHKSVTVFYEVAPDSEILTDPHVTPGDIEKAIAAKDTHVTYAQYSVDNSEGGHDSGHVSRREIKIERAKNNDFDLTDSGESGAWDSIDWLTDPDSNTNEQFVSKLESTTEDIVDIAEVMKQTAREIREANAQ